MLEEGSLCFLSWCADGRVKAENLNGTAQFEVAVYTRIVTIKKTGHFAGDFRMEWNKLAGIETRKRNGQSEMKLPFAREEMNEIVL